MTHSNQRLCLFLLCYLLCWFWSCVPKTTGKLVAKPAPKPASVYVINLPQIDNVDYNFSELKGKVAIVDFFASFCTPCLLIIPQLKKLYHSHRDKGLLVVGIALERQVQQILVPYLQFLRVDYPVVVADEQIYRGDTIFGNVQSIPMLFLFDRCGRIHRIYQGIFDIDDLRREIDALLPQQPNCSQSK
jgi:thiol-disulfide isomerase/thioredoxin